MNQALAIAVLTVVAALLMMGGELVLSQFNERQLRAKRASSRAIPGSAASTASPFCALN